MGFNNTLRRLQRQRSESHAWIDLHRLVEAYCNSVGVPFNVVFGELEREYGFERARPERWPDLETMRRAALALEARRERALAERRAWAARPAQPEEPVPPSVRDAEAHVRAYSASRPRVGVWGWRTRRNAGR